MSFLKLSVLFGVLVLSSLETSASHILPRAFTVGQAVKTTSGTVIGHAAKNRTQVSEYLGIPYAQPPVGNLRFAAPLAFQGNGTITAANYVSCQQDPAHLIASTNTSTNSHRKCLRFDGEYCWTWLREEYSDCPANTGGAALSNPAFLATLAGPSAIQLLAELGQAVNNQSEDCLTLNVWTKPQTGETAKGTICSRT